MAMTAWVRLGLATLACGSLSACGSSSEGGGDGDCVSHYSSLGGARTWAGLQSAMLSNRDWGRVASLRTQARGTDVGAGDQNAVRVVDLLDRKGRRLIQADVWRTDAGAWRAGVWNQCID
jgi:hypothetical protein